MRWFGRGSADPQALLVKAVQIAAQGRHGDALPIFDQLREIFERKPDAARPELVAPALYNHGVALREHGLRDRALDVWAELVRQLGEHRDPAVNWNVLCAQHNRGEMLRAAGRKEEAFRVFTALEQCAVDRDTPRVLERIGLAICNRAYIFADLGQPEASIAEHDRALALLDARAEPALAAIAASARGNKADLLLEAGRLEEALALFRSSAERLAYAPEPELIEARAVAWLNQAVVLGRLRRFDEELATYEALIDELGYRTEPVVLEQVAKARFNRARTLSALERHDEALSAYSDLIAEIGARRDPMLFELVGNAIRNKALILERLGRAAELENVKREASALDRDLQRDAARLAARHGSADDDAELARAHELTACGIALAGQERFDEALALWDEVQVLLGRRTGVPAQRSIATALDCKGVALVGLGHLEWAADVFEDLIARFKNRSDEQLEHLVGRARNHLDALRRSGARSRRTTLALLVNYGLRAPWAEIQARGGRPHFVDSRLHKNQTILQLRYMAQDPSQLAEQIGGGSLVFSLIRRFQQDIGPHFAPEIVLESPACLPADRPESLDTNYVSLVELLTLGLSLEHACEGTGFGALAGLMRYELRMVALTPGEQALFLYVPPGSSQ